VIKTIPVFILIKS